MGAAEDEVYMEKSEVAGNSTSLQYIYILITMSVMDLLTGSCFYEVTDF